MRMLPIGTALNGRPGACQGVGIEGELKQGMGSHLKRKRGRGRDRNWHSGRP